MSYSDLFGISKCSLELGDTPPLTLVFDGTLLKMYSVLSWLLKLLNHAVDDEGFTEHSGW